MLPESPEAAPLAENLKQFTTSPITGIHLWFDREISDLDHAVLLDRTIQWMFHKSRLIEAREKGSGSYVELVVSCSRSLVEKSKAEIVEMAVREAQEFFPEARAAKLMKSTVIKEVNATYSPGPGMDQYRPKPETAWPRVFLAGDWTATGLARNHGGCGAQRISGGGGGEPDCREWWEISGSGLAGGGINEDIFLATFPDPGFPSMARLQNSRLMAHGMRSYAASRLLGALSRCVRTNYLRFSTALLSRAF